MSFPSSKIVTAVNRNTTALGLPLNFVLAKQVKLAILPNSHTAGMGIDKITVSVLPSSSRNNVFRLCRGGKQEIRKRSSTKHGGPLGQEKETVKVIFTLMYKRPRRDPVYLVPSIVGQAYMWLYQYLRGRQEEVLGWRIPVGDEDLSVKLPSEMCRNQDEGKLKVVILLAARFERVTFFIQMIK